MSKDVFIVIPAYNEEATLAHVLKDVKNFNKNIVVIDDGSKDNTFQSAKDAGVDVLKHIINLGKGAALKTGCDYAIKQGAERIIVMDADQQHEPTEIPNFLRELEHVDVVLGYRKQNKNMPGLMRFGNRFINYVTKVLYGIQLHDTQCGYRAFTADAYKKIRWKSSNYSMESEMISNIGKHHLTFKEVPIKTIYNDRYKGTTILDGAKIVMNMFWWRLSK